jgi:hypothetical protein
MCGLDVNTFDVTGSPSCSVDGGYRWDGYFVFSILLLSAGDSRLNTVYLSQWHGGNHHGTVGYCAPVFFSEVMAQQGS